MISLSVYDDVIFWAGAIVIRVEDINEVIGLNNSVAIILNSESVSKIADTLVGINKTIGEATLLTKQISDAAEEQVKGTERVVKAVEEVASIARGSVSSTQEVSSSVEEQSASMEEMTTSAQELARLAGGLKDAVAKFKLGEIKQ